MLKSKAIDGICIFAAFLALLFTIMLINGRALGLTPASRAPGYASRLFDSASAGMRILLV